jgi:hypothetical protein
MMADYLVWKEGDKLEFVLHSQYREEDLLLRDFVPGENLVVIPNVTEEQIEEHANLYFNREYAEPQIIDSWKEGALQRQAYLKAR